MKVAIVDCETTGMDSEADQIIEMAAVLLEIDAFGALVRILGSAESLRNPGIPIPEEIQRITGISEDDVASIHFSADHFVQILSSADVCVAHNAAFDVRFIERLMPQVAGRPWACSLRQFDWRGAGFDGSALGHLLLQTGYFSTGHRAMADVISLLHVLLEPYEHGTILAALIKTAAEPTVRVEATGAPFDKRHVLKCAGYNWDASRRVWWTEVSPLLSDIEEAWLSETVLPRNRQPNSRSITWHERHR